jgi:hypothetical protein
VVLAVVGRQITIIPLRRLSAVVQEIHQLHLHHKATMVVMAQVSEMIVVVYLERKVAEVGAQVRRVLMLPEQMVMGVTVAQAPLLQFLVHQ